jgi:molybdenum cofactor biosynthesis enzyme MoaA
MTRRVDQSAALGTSIITLSGGEPLTHPELDGIIARIRRQPA